MFFARPGTYKPCGIYTIGHVALLAIVTIGVVIALKYTKDKSNEEVKKIIRKITIFLWILEIIKIQYLRLIHLLIEKRHLYVLIFLYKIH